jgi:hypothetical protein
VIQIEYDPKVISYDKLLETFWEAHDPTTLNRQDPDSGTQYRSIILYSSEAQKAAAEKSKAEARKHFSKPIVTEIVPLRFYAEIISRTLRQERTIRIARRLLRRSWKARRQRSRSFSNGLASGRDHQQPAALRSGSVMMRI